MSNAIANQLFLAYLGRPADTQWRNATGNLLNGSAPSTALQTAFYNAAVADGVFAATDSPSTLVNKIFNQIFGFAASTFEQNAWGNLISTGVISTQTAAWTIFSSYLGATNVPDSYKIPAQSKLIAADAYITQLANDPAANAALSQASSAAATAARTFLAGITTQGQAASAQTSIATTVSSISTSQTGQTYSLTTGVDSITGTSGSDRIGGVTSGTSVTLTAVDSIDGGSGVDTLALQTDAGLASLNIKNVEIISVTATANTPTVNLSGLTGVTTVENNGSSSALTFGNVAAAGTINVKSSAVTTTVVYAESALSNTSDSVTINLDNVTGGSTVNVDSSSALGAGVETLVLRASGTASSITLASVDSTISTLTISGDKSLTLALSNAGGNVATSVRTVDASGLTESLSLSGFGAANHTVTGGTGGDTFTFGTTLDANDSVNGGAGTDTIAITSSAAQTQITAAVSAKISNVEAVSFTDGGAGDTSDDVSQDAGLLTGVSTFTVNAIAAAADNYSFSNVGAANTFNVRGQNQVATALTIALKDATTGLNDVVTVNLGTASETSATGVTLATLANPTGVETVNIVSLGIGSATTNTLTTSNAAGKHVVTGDASLTLSTAANTTQIDASAFKGALTLGGGTAYAMSGGNVQAGSGNDVITAGANDQSINGGAGNDTITGGAGNDTVTGGAGADTFLVGAIGSSTAPSADTLTVAIANGNTITFGNGVDVVTDFTTGTDKIDVPVAATAALNALSLLRNLDLVANVTYTLLGTFNAATRVFTVDGTATASTANVATALVVGDVGFSTFQNTTGWTILQGVVTTAAADFV